MSVPFIVGVFHFSLPPTVAPCGLHSFLHDALPIFPGADRGVVGLEGELAARGPVRRDDHALRSLDRGETGGKTDRKSTRLNSSHRCISYAVFCLKKKSTNPKVTARRDCRSA